jgi:TRAP-type mannitol/chloroaromatic compound transport system permease large subunit
MFRSDYLALWIGGGWRQTFEFAVPANIDRPQTKRSMTMKKLVQSIIPALLVIVLIVGLSGCTKEGPAEKAGKKIDNAIEKAGDRIEKAGDKVQDTVKDAKK